MADILNITDESFEKVTTESNVPVLVDFWAPWCGPCKQVAPVLEAVAPEYDGRLQIAKLNVDDNTEAAKKYGVRGIPTLLILKEGEVVATKVGALSSDQLKAFIDEHVADEHVADEGVVA